MAVVNKKLIIDGMHCTSCAVLIDMDLEELEGVESANTSYAKQIIEIKFDDQKVSLPKIEERVVKTGYRVSSVVD